MSFKFFGFLCLAKCLIGYDLNEIMTTCQYIRNINEYECINDCILCCDYFNGCKYTYMYTNNLTSITVLFINFNNPGYRGMLFI